MTSVSVNERIRLITLVESLEPLENGSMGERRSSLLDTYTSGGFSVPELEQHVSSQDWRRNIAQIHCFMGLELQEMHENHMSK